MNLLLYACIYSLTMLFFFFNVDEGDALDARDALALEGDTFFSVLCIGDRLLP